MGRPAAKLVTRLLVAATERMNWVTEGRPRLPNLATGHCLSCATRASLELGFYALG
jgi:hypothetical protein